VQTSVPALEIVIPTVCLCSLHVYAARRIEHRHLCTPHDTDGVSNHLASCKWMSHHQCNYRPWKLTVRRRGAYGARGTCSVLSMTSIVGSSFSLLPLHHRGCEDSVARWLRAMEEPHDEAFAPPEKTLSWVLTSRQKRECCVNISLPTSSCRV
jgi:hypothetical protein